MLDNLAVPEAVDVGHRAAVALRACPAMEVDYRQIAIDHDALDLEARSILPEHGLQRGNRSLPAIEDIGIVLDIVRRNVRLESTAHIALAVEHGSEGRDHRAVALGQAPRGPCIGKRRGEKGHGGDSSRKVAQSCHASAASAIRR